MLRRDYRYFSVQLLVLVQCILIKFQIISLEHAHTLAFLFLSFFSLNFCHQFRNNGMGTNTWRQQNHICTKVLFFYELIFYAKPPVSKTLCKESS